MRQGLVSSSEMVEMRCPTGPRRLLAKLRQSGRRPSVVEGNLIEFACPDCARRERKTDPTVFRVLHRFDLIGTLVESEVVHDQEA